MFFCTSCPLSGCFCLIALIKIQRQQRFQKNMRKKQFFFNKGLFFFSNCVIIYGTSICGCVNERELSKIFVYSALDYRNPQKRGMVGIAQLVRASGCGPEGRRFEPDYSPHPAAGCRKEKTRMKYHARFFISICCTRHIANPLGKRENLRNRRVFHTNVQTLKAFVLKNE